MADFFTYTSHYRTGIYYELNSLEHYLPIILVFFGAFLIIYFKDSIKNNKLLDKKIRISVGIVFAILYFSHYALRFAIYGFDTINLPFQLCSISMFLAIILIFTKNRTIYSFVLFTGVAGGLISMFVPVIGYDSSFYRYYQYMIAHGILVLTPIYFMVVHSYVPSKKEVFYSYLILQALAKFMLAYNYFYGTDFMFVFLDPAKIEKFPVITKFGGIPFYLIWVELAAAFWFYISYLGINFFSKNEFIKKEIINKEA